MKINEIIKPLDQFCDPLHVDVHADKVLINSVETAERASMLKDEIQHLSKKLEGNKNIELTPLKEKVNEINGRYKPIIEKLSKAKQIIIRKLTDYKRAIEAEQRKREIEEAKAKEPDKKDNSIESLISQAKEIAPEKKTLIAMPKINLREKTITVIQVMDVKKVPAKYLQDDRVLNAIKTAVRADVMAGKNIPGIKSGKEKVSY